MTPKVNDVRIHRAELLRQVVPQPALLEDDQDEEKEVLNSFFAVFRPDADSFDLL